MNRAARLLAVIASGYIVAGASPEPMTVFGLELGKPLTIPVCERKLMPGGYRSQFTYESDPKETCYEPDIQLSDAPWRRGSVNFPLQSTPSILPFNSGFTLIVDGKLEGVQFSTRGYGDADVILNQLTGKFGKPTSLDETTSTVSGIPLPAIEAHWRLPNLHVSYISIDQSVEYGLLRVETDVMWRIRDAHERAKAAQRIEL
jgi:hypothetical protein